MKKLIILLLLISLSGCSSSLVKDEKTSQKIELTKEIEESMQVIQIDVGSSTRCCSYSVPKDYFYKNQDEVLKVLRQRCGPEYSPDSLDPEKTMKFKKDLLKGRKRPGSNLTTVEVGGR
jgi:hypothetical protein